MRAAERREVGVPPLAGESQAIGIGLGPI